MTIWQEIFTVPTPTVEPSLDEWNLAWNWIFEKPDLAVIRLAACRKHSLLLRRQGVVKSAQMASVGLWQRCIQSEIKMPQRRIVED